MGVLFLGWGTDPAQSPTWISRRALRSYLSLCTGKASPALGTHDARLNSNLLGDALNAWSSHEARSTCKSKRSHECQEQATASCFHCGFTCFFSLKPTLEAHGNTPERSPHTGHSTPTFRQGPGSTGSPPGFSLYPLENGAYAGKSQVGTVTPQALQAPLTWESLVSFGSLGASVTHGPRGPRVAHESLLTLGPCNEDGTVRINVQNGVWGPLPAVLPASHDTVTFLPRKPNYTGLALGPWVPNPSFLSGESCSSSAPLISFDSRKCI